MQVCSVFYCRTLSQITKVIIMNFLSTLEAHIKEAMKARDTLRLEVVRFLKSYVKNKEIELGHSLTEQEFIAVVNSLCKQRLESIQQFEISQRADLVAKENAELTILRDYLPKPLSEAQLNDLIEQAMASTGESGPKALGAVMKWLKEPTAGKVDGRVLSEKVKQRLGVG
jgi:hypothetical protein